MYICNHHYYYYYYYYYHYYYYSLIHLHRTPSRQLLRSAPNPGVDKKLGFQMSTQSREQREIITNPRTLNRECAVLHIHCMGKRDHQNSPVGRAKGLLLLLYNHTFVGFTQTCSCT